MRHLPSQLYLTELLHDIQYRVDDIVMGSNAIRHSGATGLATAVRVDDGLCVETVDDGRGITSGIVLLRLARLA